MALLDLQGLETPGGKGKGGGPPGASSLSIVLCGPPDPCPSNLSLLLCG